MTRGRQSKVGMVALQNPQESKLLSVASLYKGGF